MVHRRNLARRLVTALSKLPLSSHFGAILLAGVTLCVGTYVIVHVGLVVILLIAALGLLLGQKSIGIGLGIFAFLLGGPLALLYVVERIYRDISEYYFQTRVWTAQRLTFLAGIALGIGLYLPWLTLPTASYGAPIETIYTLVAPINATQETMIPAFILPIITVPALVALALPLEAKLIPSYFDPRYDAQHRSIRKRMSRIGQSLPTSSNRESSGQSRQPSQSQERNLNDPQSQHTDTGETRDTDHSQTIGSIHGSGSQTGNQPHQQERSPDTDPEYEFDWQFGSSVTLADVGGLKAEKKELSRKVLRPLVGNADQYEKLDLTPSNVLLYGPPGTGKSHLAKAMMGQTDLPTLSISGGNLLSRWVNASAEQIARLFEEAHTLAREHGGAIIFIDEIDSVLPTRGGANRHREDDKVVNEFLRYLETSTAEMWDDPSIPSTTDVVVIGATNNFAELDAAATRSGRVDLKLEIGMPDQTQRRAVLSAQLSQRHHSVSDATLDRVAATTDGFSAADLGATVDEAAYSAAANGRDTITESDLRTALTDYS